MKKITFIAVAFAAAALVPTAGSAQEAKPALLGAPVTTQNVVDQAEIIRIADALDAAVDAKNWRAARSLFTDQITVDFTSLIGGEPATIPADALIKGWSTNLNARKTSFHLRGNHRVSFTGENRATVLSHGYAWNRLEEGGTRENGGNPLWEVWGTYEHQLVKGDAGWRIEGMTFTATAQRGNFFVRDTIIPE